jgi:hypothetical protein
MADSKISALTAVTAPVTTDEAVVVDGGATKKITLANLAKVMPGYQLGVIERVSSNFTTTQTTRASADTALTMASITFDGSTACNFELSCFCTNSVTGTQTNLNLWEDSTDLGPLVRFEGGKATTPENGICFGRLQRTPAAGAKVYTIRGWVSGASTGTMYLGNGTTIPGAIFTITRV